MRVRFRLRVDQFRIDLTVEGRDADEVILRLRNQVASQIPHIPFTRKDDQIREKLDVDQKDDWTDAEFRAFVVDYWNNKVRRQDQVKALVPNNNQTFIDLAVMLGIATVIVP